MNDPRMCDSNDHPEARVRTVLARLETSHAVWWVTAVSLAVIAACLVFRLDAKLAPSVSAQSYSAGGARGVFAFPAQITKTSYGVYMVDVDTGTIWCYEYTGATRKLRLAAARSWRFDRYLEDLNGEDMSPSDVEQLVEQARTAKLQAGGAGP
ncbi:MAG: hypothetical protein JSV19_09110 [Phycisphaerales bacterium]|nr:MAG: hypothetical protein JSV19_09110 [Phycisphaerales bacterium]